MVSASCVLCSYSLVSVEYSFVVIGFQGLTARMEEGLSATKKAKMYCSRNMLRRNMLYMNPFFGDFVSGPKCGSGKYFFCRVCQRDVGMKTHGSGEFARQFRSDGHWYKDITYRVLMGLPVWNWLMKPMTFSESQITDYKQLAIVDIAEGYPLPEDLVPKHATVGSRVPFMTVVSSFCDLLQSGSDFILSRCLWGHFCSSLDA